MPIVYYKLLLLSLLLVILFSVLIFNAIVFDLSYDHKIVVKNICDQFATTTADDDPRYHLTYHSLPPPTDQIAPDGHHHQHRTRDTSFVNISDNILIYSAFEADTDYLVLIGLAKNLEPVSDDYNYYNYNNSYRFTDYHYLCAFGADIELKTEAVVEYLPESHDYYYSAVKIKCKKPKLYDRRLTIDRVKLIQTDAKNSSDAIESQFVSIVHTSSRQSDTNPVGPRARELVVCVRPLYGNVSAVHLLEFIAYYRLNSVDKLVFYNSFSGPLVPTRVKTLLRTLRSMPFVDVLPFVIPNDDERRPIIHARGQLTAIHDCLYRFADYTQIHVDIDEYLKPIESKTIKEFVSSEAMSRWTALVVPTVIFCTEYNQVMAKKWDPLLTANFNRQRTVWPHETRSKVVILRPKLISQMGIHSVWKLFYRRHDTHPILYVTADQLLVHHYRRCCHLIQPYFFNLIYFNTINDYIVRDESMKRFITPVKDYLKDYIIISQ